MRILVTGVSGFVGGALSKRLLAEKWIVRGLIRSPSKFKKRFKKLEIISGDLRNFKSMSKAAKGVDAVVHCAAVLPHHNLSAKEYWSINVNGVGNVVEACQENKVKKLVHISTTGIYGPTSKKGFSEKARTNLTDIYLKTKYEGDKLVWNFFKNGGRGVIIRPTIAYGPGDVRPVFLKLFRMVKMGVNLSIGNGSNYLHTIYIDNLVDGLMAAIKSKRGLGQDYIIGDEECPKMAEILGVIAKVQNRKPVKIVVPKDLALIAGKLAGMEKTVKFVSEDRRFKIDKAKRILGYKPQVGLERGMKMTYKWYQKEGLV